jgi:membrane protein
MARLRPGLRRFRATVARIAKDFFAHDVTTQGAALSFYALFSLAPVLLVVIHVAGLVWGRDAVQARIVREFAGLMGGGTGRAVDEMLHRVNRTGSSRIATAVGIFTLLSGATAFFAQLQGALNAVWGVAPREGSVVSTFLRKRLFSFALLLGIGFLLLVSLSLSAALSAIGDSISARSTLPVELLGAADVLLSYAVVTVLLAMIYRTIPDADIQWRDVWIGALVTALLISVGKWGIGLYLGRTAIASAYGAAGSVVLIVLWVYYVSVLLLLGAEFTHAHTLEFRHARRPPSAGAARTESSRRSTGPGSRARAPREGTVPRRG